MKQALSRAIVNKQLDIEQLEQVKIEDFQLFCEEESKRVAKHQRSRVNTKKMTRDEQLVQKL